MKNLWNRPWFLAGIMVVTSLVIQSRISLYSSGIDGYLISMVSNGCYGQNNYCMFIHPFISFVCGRLSFIYPSVDCYSLIILGFMTFSLYWLYFVIFSTAKTIYRKIVLILLAICYVFSTCGGLAMRFTLQAGFCMFVGLLLLLMAFRKDNKKYIVPGVLCSVFGCMIREMAAYTIIPFCVLLLFYELFEKKYRIKNYIRKCGRYFGLVIIFVLVLFLSNKLFYSQPSYADSVEYNTARSSLVDYPTKEWAEIKNQSSGYSENDYKAVTHYVWEDTKIVNKDYLSTIAEVANNNYFVQVRDIETAQGRVVFTVRSIFNIVIENVIKYPWFEAGLLILLCSLYLFIRYKALLVRVSLILGFVGFGSIILFFSLLGRAVALKELLMLGNMLLLFYFMIIFAGDKIENNIKFKIVKILVLAYITLMPFIGQKWFSPAFGVLKMASERGMIDDQKSEKVEEVILGNYQGISFLDKKENSLIDIFSAREESENMVLLDELCKDNELYIWNVFCLDDELAKLQKIDRLASKEIISHNIPIGEWTSGQIYWKEHLESIGVDNPMESLLYRPDTYYVGAGEDIVYQWLKEHYSENVEIKHVRDAGAYPVWQFVETE